MDFVRDLSGIALGAHCEAANSRGRDQKVVHFGEKHVLTLGQEEIEEPYEMKESDASKPKQIQIVLRATSSVSHLHTTM